MTGTECNGESCCRSIIVPAGPFPQGRSTVAGASDYYPGGNPDEVPEFSSTVSSFALDKYEVTVGRFREFVDAYVSNTASAPTDGAGANPAIPGSGWQSAWNANLPATQGAFKDASHLNCESTYQAWTDTPGGNETKAINCVNWYEAFAFCIWDDGWLATESEWEYAAAAGSDNRLYPWGSEAPTMSVAVYGCQVYPGGRCVVQPVGSTPAGNGKWGHADLAGNVYEWTLDWYGTYPVSASTDYANISIGSERVLRGDFWASFLAYLRAAYRGYQKPDSHDNGIGARCARSAP
jgi:formylglycine-generating enzyme required for sulfatase activity